jgi:1-aminocyclopropane-1-carboxylate deaminase/D-cysteine desulfhydrase-like pyridoxal-dependent ACC family enzyme
MTAVLRGPAGTPLAVPPRTPLAVLPTPLVPAPRLAGALGLGGLFIKRDDLTGFVFAGNKARPLEFLVAGAVREGADTLVTGGTPGSNFCVATAAAAQREGLACHLVLAGDPVPPGPALSLAVAWGASVTWTHDADRSSVDRALPQAAQALAKQGRRPYLIPRGGATALGAVGYFLAASELAGQLTGYGVRATRVVVPVGSGGSLAGLTAGQVMLGRPWTLVGASVSRPAAEMSRRVLGLAADCLALLKVGSGAVVTGADVEIADVRGPGHGLPSAEGAAAAAQAMRTEGLMTDPVYTAKALSLAARRSGSETVVFWHTGGMLDVVAAAQGVVVSAERGAAP